MKLLITGGAGFIGSNFVRYMVNKYPEYQIVNLDLLTYAGNLENLKEIENKPNYKFVRGDIADRPFVQDLFEKEKFDYVLNFAAESHVDRSITNPEIFVQTNIQGTLALLDAAKTIGVKKYLQVSTDEVYGTLGATGFFTEETPLAPNSPYSASKTGADLLVRAYHETYGLPINITRCSNNYGPYHFPEKLIPLMIINALHDKDLPVYGDGLNIRDWLHVEDHCQAIDLVLHNGRSGEVYNVGGNNERTNIDIVKTILAQLGKPDSLIKFVKDRPGHDRRYAIDATKLRTELGWKPKYTFETGIKQTIEWYLNHQEWWQNIISGEYQEYFKSQYGDRLEVEQ
nr:dTDP-glucose 4,6-dehydratase [uncultured Bacillus sp.]